MKKRELHFTNEVWRYRVSGWHVLLWNPAGKRINISFHEIIGFLFAEDEHCQVTPSIVKTYIEQKYKRKFDA